MSKLSTSLRIELSAKTFRKLIYLIMRNNPFIIYINIFYLFIYDLSNCYDNCYWLYNRCFQNPYDHFKSIARRHWYKYYPFISY